MKTMTHRNRKIGNFLLTLALLLAVCCAAACSSFPSLKGQETLSPTIAASSTPGASIRLEPCQLGAIPAQCGTLKVYENRAARTGA